MLKIPLTSECSQRKSPTNEAAQFASDRHEALEFLRSVVSRALDQNPKFENFQPDLLPGDGPFWALPWCVKRLGLFEFWACATFMPKMAPPLPAG